MKSRLYDGHVVMYSHRKVSYRPALSIISKNFPQVLSVENYRKLNYFLMERKNFCFYNCINSTQDMCVHLAFSKGIWDYRNIQKVLNMMR